MDTVTAPGAGAEHAQELLRRAALENAPRALETIVQIMNSDKAGSGDRLRAAITVIERAYGKHDAAPKAARAELLEDIEAEMERIRKDLGE